MKFNVIFFQSCIILKYCMISDIISMSGFYGLIPTFFIPLKHLK